MFAFGGWNGFYRVLSVPAEGECGALCCSVDGAMRRAGTEGADRTPAKGIERYRGHPLAVAAIYRLRRDEAMPHKSGTPQGWIAN